MRFPPTAQAKAKARAMIRDAVQRELLDNEGRILGIPGGACGGDILSHDAYQQLGVEAALYLALPEDNFEVKSVQRGGADWVELYRALTAHQVPRVLQQTEALPCWLSDKPH